MRLCGNQDISYDLLPQLFYCNKYQPVEVEKNDNKRMQGRSEEVSGPPQNYQTDGHLHSCAFIQSNNYNNIIITTIIIIIH